MRTPQEIQRDKKFAEENAWARPAHAALLREEEKSTANKSSADLARLATAELKRQRKRENNAALAARSV